MRHVGPIHRLCFLVADAHMCVAFNARSLSPSISVLLCTALISRRCSRLVPRSLLLLVLLIVACCYRKKLKSCCSHCLGRQEEHEDQAKSNGDMTTKKKEETVDADGSNSTDSDKMADEGE